MSAYAASFGNEWKKLLARKKYIVFIIIGIGVCLIGTIISAVLNNVSFADPSFREIKINLSTGPMYILGFFTSIMLPFLLFMAATDLFTVESSDNTMKAVLVRPVSRWKLYLAKLSAVLAYVAVYLGIVFVLTSVLYGISRGGVDFGELATSFLAYLLTLVPLSVLICAAGMVAVSMGSGSLVMFVLLLGYLVLNTLPVIFPVLTELLFTSYLGWYKLWIGTLPDPAKLIRMLLTVVGYWAVFFTAGTLIFDRKEF